MAASRATVVIPTLQRSDRLGPLIDTFAAHPRVGEVLVINNSPQLIEHHDPKVLVLQQDHNIYVNPAWNLGYREAAEDYLIIANDDIGIDATVIDYGLHLLDRNFYPIVGMHGSSISLPGPGRPKHRPAPFVNLGWGALMFLRRSHYQPIPEQLRIYGGDDWLFYRQRRPGGIILGLPMRTTMGTTSAAEEFDPVRTADRAYFAEHVEPMIGASWWHRLLPWINRTSQLSARLRR